MTNPHSSHCSFWESYFVLFRKNMLYSRVFLVSNLKDHILSSKYQTLWRDHILLHGAGLSICGTLTAVCRFKVPFIVYCPNGNCPYSFKYVVTKEWLRLKKKLGIAEIRTRHCWRQLLPSPSS